MKKRLVVLSLLAAGVLGLASAGVAWAGPGFGVFKSRGQINRINIDKTTMVENKAAILGITAEALEKELEAGKTFYTLMQEKGLSFNDLHNRAKEQARVKLAELVKSGDITQKQMDRQLQFIDEHHAEALSSGGMMGGMMGGPGFGWSHMGW